MKKFFIVTVSFLFVLLTACGSVKEFKEGTSCEDVLNAVIEVTMHPDADKIYLSSKENLDSESFSLWVDGLYQESSEIELFSDYAIFVSAGTTTYEVAVLKACKEDGTGQLEEIFERRKNTLALGDKGMYDPNFSVRMNSSKILTVGDMVILLITDDNDAAAKAIENLK